VDKEQVEVSIWSRFAAPEPADGDEGDSGQAA
jgi:hypothetical protein